MPTGIPSTRRSFFRFVLPPRSTLLADQEWKGCISPRVFTDRKSTRLNSSHGYISYAVFCLKKKKQNIISVSLNSNTFTFHTYPSRAPYRIVSPTTPYPHPSLVHSSIT